VANQIKTSRDALTQERLKELLHYDPGSGILRWRVARFAGQYHTKVNVQVGDVAGCKVTYVDGSKYIHVRIDGILYPAQNVAWLYMTGEVAKMVDHQDCDGLNNKFSNLRPCTKSQNAANSRKAKNNSSGVKGVYWDATRGKWVAEIRCGNIRHRLGRFDELEVAALAYAAKARELFGEFARTA